MRAFQPARAFPCLHFVHQGTALLLFTSAYSAWNKHTLSFATAHTFSADIVVTVKDAKTGVVIDDYVASLNPVTRLVRDLLSKAEEAKLIYSSENHGGASRRTMRVKGKIIHSARIGFVTGEHVVTYATIDKNTPSELTVELQPLKR